MLAACSSSSGPGATAGSTTSSGSTTVVVGATLPLTGTGAVYGKSMLQGLQLGLKDAQAQLTGVTLKLKALDDQALAAPAVAAARQLLAQDKAQVIVTAYSAPPLAQLPLAEQFKVPLLNGGGNTPPLSGHAWLFNDAFMVSQGGSAMMKYAHDTLGVKKLSVMIDSNYPQETQTAYESIWNKLSGANPAVQFVPADTTDAGPPLDKLLASHPDALFLSVGGTTLSLVVSQLEQRNLRIPVISNDGAVIATPGALKAQFPFYYATPAKVASATLNSAYTAAYGAAPDFLAVQNYNLGRIIGAGVASLMTAKKPVTGANLQALFNDTSATFAVDGGTISFTSDHIASQDAAIIELVGGKSTTVSANVPTS